MVFSTGTFKFRKIRKFKKFCVLFYAELIDVPSPLQKLKYIYFAKIFRLSIILTNFKNMHFEHEVSWFLVLTQKSCFLSPRRTDTPFITF